MPDIASKVWASIWWWGLTNRLSNDLRASQSFLEIKSTHHSLTLRLHNLFSQAAFPTTRKNYMQDNSTSINIQFQYTREKSRLWAAAPQSSHLRYVDREKEGERVLYPFLILSMTACLSQRNWLIFSTSIICNSTLRSWTVFTFDTLYMYIVITWINANKLLQDYISGSSNSSR